MSVNMFFKKTFTNFNRLCYLPGLAVVTSSHFNVFLTKENMIKLTKETINMDMSKESCYYNL